MRMIPIAERHIEKTEPIVEGDEWRSMTTGRTYKIVGIGEDVIHICDGVLNPVRVTPLGLRYGFCRIRKD